MAKNERMKRIYISGPMRAFTNLNAPAFMDAELYLEKLGYATINPIRATYLLKPEFTTDDEYLALDLYLLDMCDGIYMLDGWRNSEGAMLEYNRAKELGIPILYQEVVYATGE